MLAHRGARDAKLLGDLVGSASFFVALQELQQILLALAEHAQSGVRFHALGRCHVFFSSLARPWESLAPVDCSQRLVADDEFLSIASTSARVWGSCAQTPRIARVNVTEFCSCTPRIAMHI